MKKTVLNVMMAVVFCIMSVSMAYAENTVDPEEGANNIKITNSIFATSSQPADEETETFDTREKDYHEWSIVAPRRPETSATPSEPVATPSEPKEVEKAEMPATPTDATPTNSVGTYRGKESNNSGGRNYISKSAEAIEQEVPESVVIRDAAEPIDCTVSDDELPVTGDMGMEFLAVPVFFVCGIAGLYIRKK